MKFLAQIQTLLFFALSFSFSFQASGEIHVASVDFDNCLYALRKPFEEGHVQTALFQEEFLRLGVQQIFFGSSRSCQDSELYHIGVGKGESLSRFGEFVLDVQNEFQRQQRPVPKFYPVLLEDLHTYANALSKKDVRSRGAFYDFLSSLTKPYKRGERQFESLQGDYGQAEKRSRRRSSMNFSRMRSEIVTNQISQMREVKRKVFILPNKEDLLFFQMQITAHHYWNYSGIIHFHFYDDDKNILTQLRTFYSNHTEMIPARIRLHFHHVGKNPFTDEERTILYTKALHLREGYSDLTPIQGTGLRVLPLDLKARTLRLQSDLNPLSRR